MKLIGIKYFSLLTLALTTLIAACGDRHQKEGESQQPNVIILFSDDAGYADFSMNGNQLIKTPNIDAIAKNGITFTNGYVSGPVCSPSRAGLMTGRYQQRFGHECNLGGNYTKVDEELLGLPVGELTIADLMKQSGYCTGMIGKWHLGEKQQFHPCNRGFDYFFGMLGGSSAYHAGKASSIIRNFEQVNYKALPYLTDAFGDEACSFIAENKEHPFFLYVSFNAPHTPMHARPDYLAEAKSLFETEQRAVNAAMTRSLDDNVGKVMTKLKQLDLDDNTLVFFTNDNGGAMPYNASCNDPFSGTKGTFLEGGIHVPFLAQWPEMIPAGAKYIQPVITLDILPTSIAAAGGECPPDRKYDGVNLLPYITQKSNNIPHSDLYWRLQHHGAIRKGNWKLIWFDDKAPCLYNLDTDISEQTDLAEEYPLKTKELLDDFNRWQKELQAPIWVSDPKWKEHSRQRYDQSYVNSLKKR
ncbi:sulfatase [Carboxylicivirga mesophila]|uniref:Sulfatase n=1 Tax=Carboxylicivirga mesophila TaxID=1166478 RepID=A0ABS5KD88_9BACT|nr:sulfatase [Carboxylicivirga mesophila]MBS2212990.1 sulfatase [Carboxylicivirga mesophila]